MKFDLRVRFAAEFLGTAFLVAAVVGSDIMGERLKNLRPSLGTCGEIVQGAPRLLADWR